MCLCLETLERVPDADIVVIHKLMIEADEETYLRKANHLFPFPIDYDGAYGQVNISQIFAPPF